MTFAVFLMAIGFVGITLVHANPAVINKSTERLWACMKNPKPHSEYCSQITALDPLDDKPNTQSTVAEQNPETVKNRDTGIESGNFPLTQQAWMEMIFNSQIDETFTDIALLEATVSPGKNFSLARGIGYFDSDNSALEVTESFELSEYFLSQFSAEIESMRLLRTGKQ